METAGQEEADRALRKSNGEHFHALGCVVVQYARSNETWYVKFYLNTLTLLLLLPLLLQQQFYNNNYYYYYYYYYYCYYYY